MDISTPVSVQALFTLAKMWKQPKYLSPEHWIKVGGYTYTLEYYSALKNKEILTNAATWMRLEDMMVSEINQLQKDCKIPLIWGT